MAEGSNNSLVNLGDISKPVDTLIKKISSVVGGVFAPYQIRRVAKAEADASITKAKADADVALILAESEINTDSLRRRGMHRLIEEEAKHQANMEAITQKAFPQLTEGANAEDIDDDWLTNFFEKSRIVSNEQMQQLWANILAGEANVPGSYSRRTVNTLSDLDRSDCDAFAQLCRYCWLIPGRGLEPLIFNTSMDPAAQIYQKHGVSFDQLIHLESIGLIQFNQLQSYSLLGVGKKWLTAYHGRPLVLEMPRDSNNHLDIGKVLLTRVGRDFANICRVDSVDGFYEYISNRWASYHTAPDETSSPTDSK